ncbi:MAG: hypothetical protein H6668_21030 [Ardenticatenaceae bacterium]|nr:hypothetical protein [Ardenticatenaceae bacterium]
MPTFFVIVTTLAAQLADEPAWHDDVAAILYQIWAHYLPLRSDDDLAIKLNQLLTIMGAFGGCF